jgi:hypothetical protein
MEFRNKYEWMEECQLKSEVWEQEKYTKKTYIFGLISLATFKLALNCGKQQKICHLHYTSMTSS